MSMLKKKAILIRIIIRDFLFRRVVCHYQDILNSAVLSH